MVRWVAMKRAVRWVAMKRAEEVVGRKGMVVGVKALEKAVVTMGRAMEGVVVVMKGKEAEGKVAPEAEVAEGEAVVERAGKR